MTILSFDNNNTGCALPPFELNRSRQYFFRVNAFEMELPVDLLDPGSNAGKKHNAIVSMTAHLGLPITDVFPFLLADYEPLQHKIGSAQLEVRLDRNIYLPATSLNRHFESSGKAQVKMSEIANGGIEIDGKKFGLSQEHTADLKAGRPVTLRDGKKLIRLMPPPAEARQDGKDQPPVALSQHLRAAKSGGSGTHFASVRDLSDADFETLCDASFEGIPNKDFAWILRLSRIDLWKLINSCKKDPRFSAWDDKRSGKRHSEPPQYEIGFISEYEQVWELRGYSRGGLVSSITLAPEEELTLEIFTWDRNKLEEERNQSTEVERSLETSALSRVSAQINSDLTETTDKSANLSLGASLAAVGFPGQVDGGVSVSSNITQGIETTVETINETTQKAAERFKSATQIKVTQTRETGTETRVTRKIRNPNRGQTLTMHCFEVMEHYKVTTRLLRAEKFVLLVNIPQPKSFEIPFVLAHEDKLQRALLGSGFLPGFEAAKKLLAQGFFDERSRIKAEIEAAQAKARGDQSTSSDTPVDPPIVAVAKELSKKLDKLAKVDLIQKIGTLADSYLPWGEKISDKERAQAEDALGMFNFWLTHQFET